MHFPMISRRKLIKIKKGRLILKIQISTFRDEDEELLQQGDLTWTDLKVPEDAISASTQDDTRQPTQNDQDTEEAEG